MSQPEPTPAISRRAHYGTFFWRLGTALVFLVWMARTTDAANPECSQIVSRLNRQTRLGTGGMDISKLAKEMNTSVAWVEQCMRAYGRRPRRPGLESAEGRETRLEAMENYEPEETSEPEDRGVLHLPKSRDRPPRPPVRKKGQSPFSVDTDPNTY